MRIMAKACIALLLSFGGGASLAVPITDTISVDGTEWAQVDSFDGVLWAELNAVCPGGVCGGGSVKGFELAGWTWASVEDVNMLFNYYLQGAGVSGSDLLGPGLDSYSDRGVAWDNTFIAAGWRYTFGPPYILTGITSDAPVTDPSEIHIGSIVSEFYYPKFSIDIAASVNTFRVPENEPPPIDGLPRGAWIFRNPSVDVPLPSSLILMLAGVALLALNRSSVNSEN